MINKFKNTNIKNKEKLQEYINFCKNMSEINGEDHHILPQELFPEYKSLYANPWNKSTLSIINHIKAHILLCEAIDNNSMYHARNMMLFTRDYNEENISVEYLQEIEKIKIESRKIQSKLMRENNPMKNEETKNKSVASRKKYFENGGVGSMFGRTHSEETKEKMSKIHKGKIIKDESKSNLKGYITRYGEIEGTKKYKENNKKKSVTLESQIEKYGQKDGTKRWNQIIEKKSNNSKGEKNHFYGKTHSEEMKKQLSEKAKNRTKLECPHCRKLLSPAMAKRWHFNNCKLKDK